MLLKHGNLWPLLEPPGPGPLLHLHLASSLLVVLVADGLHLGAPFPKLQVLGNVGEVKAVEVDETGAVPVDGGDVDDASAGSVDLPVLQPGPGIGTTHLAILGQVQAQLLQGLHDEVNVE